MYTYSHRREIAENLEFPSLPTTKTVSFEFKKRFRSDTGIRFGHDVVFLSHYSSYRSDSVLDVGRVPFGLFKQDEW